MVSVIIIATLLIIRMKIRVEGILHFTYPEGFVEIFASPKVYATSSVYWMHQR